MSDTNILIIGNGFDLAHNLPTRYTDFITFVNEWKSLYNNMREENYSGCQDSIPAPEDGKMTTEYVSSFLNVSLKFYNKDLLKRFDDLVNSNLWLKYFKRIHYNKEKWIDFELEIGNVVSLVSRYYEMLPSSNGKRPSEVFDDDTIKITDLFANGETRFFSSIHQLSLSDLTPSNIKASKEQTIDKMISNLDDLIEMLDIYFTEFVGKIKLSQVSPDILSIKNASVVSFNYTNYIENYRNIRQVHYVHGILSCFQENNTNSIVLGIDDDLISDTDFVRFQKYFQRIQKRTGTKYKEWITQPVVMDSEFFKVHVFGHSLAYNDKSILSYFLDNIYVNKIFIYYINQESYEKLIINLIKMFDKDFVIKNVSEGRIEFLPVTKAENAISDKKAVTT